MSNSVISRLRWLLGWGRYGMERKKIFVDSQKVVSERKSAVKMRYYYRDGFVVEAYNLRQADKAHRRWWAKVGKGKINTAI